jgi:hypothetical protein
MGYATRIASVPASKPASVPDAARRGAVREALADVRSTLRHIEPDRLTPDRPTEPRPEARVPNRASRAVRRAMDAID